MSVVFMGLAGRYDNAGEIIPLGEALNVYPTCGRLETKNETVGGARPSQNGFPHYLICPFHQDTNDGDCLFFRFPTQTDVQ